jgi:transposase insI for insertion sequence element IS30B/C/D
MSLNKYTQLSYEERVIIENRLKNNESIRYIAKKLDRNPSTIMREIKRNGIKARTTRINKPKELYLDSRHYRGGKEVAIIQTRKKQYYKRLKIFNKPKYLAKMASVLMNKRIRRQALKLETATYIETRKYVDEKLRLRWSPEQISGRLRLEDKLLYVSHKAIYHLVYSEGLEKHLRRKGRKPRSYKILKFNNTNRDKHHISERPKEIDELKYYGDLEGDTIFGLKTTDRILTHVDRKSGLLSASLIHSYNAHKIAKQTKLDIASVFGEIKSITYDNGIEFSLWRITEKELNANIYFASPYHSWERGRNENTNGLIRDFIPKGTDFKKLTKRDIVEIANLINNRPRKRLEWKTPLEVYRSPGVALEGLE